MIVKGGHVNIHDQDRAVAGPSVAPEEKRPPEAAFLRFVLGGEASFDGLAIAEKAETGEARKHHRPG